MKCQNCKNKILKDADFCPICGTKVNKRKINKKIILLIIIGILIILFSIFLILWFNKKNMKDYSSFSSSSSISYSYNENNTLKFIDGKFSDVLVKTSDDVLLALEDIKDKIGIKDIKKELMLASKETSFDTTYYKYNQLHNGIEVLDQSIIIAVDKNNKILSYSGYYIPDISIDTSPKMNKLEIENIIKESLGTNSTIYSNQLKVWSDYESQTLIYNVIGYSDSKAVEIIIDANTGEILSEVSLFEHADAYTYTAAGIDNKIFTINLEEYKDILGIEKNKYNFYDPIRKISIADYRFTGPVIGTLASAFPGTTPMSVYIRDGKIDMTFQNEEFIKNAITTLGHYEMIYDYYKDVLGRNSFDNKGSKIIINLGITEETFTNKDLNNAMWCYLTNQMYIGSWNGKSLSASLDVLAHEFTHGVVNYTANFANSPKKEDKNKAFESGALNEAYADIMGSLIEGKNWTIAESNEILRSAKNPEAYNDPSIKGGANYYPDGYLSNEYTLEQFLEKNNFKYATDYDNGGVHVNSNVVSHAAYLMYDAKAFTDRKEMAKVWYNSLFLLSSYSDFEDCALAVIKSAKNLGLDDSAIYKITKAFQDTKMLEAKEHTLKGNITSKKEYIQDAKIEIYSYSDNSLITSSKSGKTGKYEISLPAGTYKIKITKDDFKEFTKNITIKGETTLDINLASTKVTEKNPLKNACTTDKCYNFTVYFLEGDENDLEEKYETYAMDAGTILDANIIVDGANSAFGSKILSTDGTSFYITISGFTVEFAWYYKDTNTKFTWNQPLNEDIEIEMKLFDGILDNDILNNIYNLFK